MAPKKKVMSEELHGGQIIEDVRKVKWQIVKVIGQGAFGTVYEVKKVDGNDGEAYALKIEPKGSGPLFNEISFFMRCLKLDNINEWNKKNNVAFLGVPTFHGNGILNVNGLEHRFLVMSRFYKNIDAILAEKKDHLVSFASQVIDALRYIHDCGYVHGDIKGENLLANEAESEIYLNDFGLAARCYNKETLIPDKKCVNDGTPNFCSRDNHIGVTSMRGDMETLGYNLWKWCCGELPWQNVKAIQGKQQSKNDFMDNLDRYAKESKAPSGIVTYLKEVKKLGHSEKPPYSKLKEILGQLDVSKCNLIAKPAKKAKVLKQIAPKAKKTAVESAIEPSASDLNVLSRTRGRKTAKVDYAESPVDSPVNAKKPKQAKNLARKIATGKKTFDENHQDEKPSIASKVPENDVASVEIAKRGKRVIKGKGKTDDRESEPEEKDMNDNATKAVGNKGKKTLKRKGMAKDQGSECGEDNDQTETIVKKRNGVIKRKGQAKEQQNECDNGSNLFESKNLTEAITGRRKRAVTKGEEKTGNLDSLKFAAKGEEVNAAEVVDDIERKKHGLLHTKMVLAIDKMPTSASSGEDDKINDATFLVDPALQRANTVASSLETRVEEKTEESINIASQLAVINAERVSPPEPVRRGKRLVQNIIDEEENEDVPKSMNPEQKRMLKVIETRKKPKKNTAAITAGKAPAEEETETEDLINKAGPVKSVAPYSKKVSPSTLDRRGKRVAQNSADGEKNGDALKPAVNSEQEGALMLAESRKKLKRSPIVRNTANEVEAGTGKEPLKRVLNLEEERILKLKEENKKGGRKGKGVAKSPVNINGRAN